MPLLVLLVSCPLVVEEEVVVVAPWEDLQELSVAQLRVVVVQQRAKPP